MILDGGVLRYAGDEGSSSSPTGNAVFDNLEIASDSIIEMAPGRNTFFTIDSTLTGPGNVTFGGAGSGWDSELTISDLSNYTGNSNVTAGLIVGFDTDYEFPGTFDLSDSDSRLELMSGRTLTFQKDALTYSGGNTVAPGTYSGASLDGLGANFVNSGGTLTVIPEAGTLLILAFMAPLTVMLRRYVLNAYSPETD